MATNRLGFLHVHTSQTLPFSNPVVVEYTAEWKPAERLSDTNLDTQTISGIVNMTGTETWAETRDAIIADIQAKMSGDTLEEGTLA